MSLGQNLDCNQSTTVTCVNSFHASCAIVEDLLGKHVVILSLLLQWMLQVDVVHHIFPDFLSSLVIAGFCTCISKQL